MTRTRAAPLLSLRLAADPSARRAKRCLSSTGSSSNGMRHWLAASFCDIELPIQGKLKNACILVPDKRCFSSRSIRSGMRHWSSSPSDDDIDIPMQGQFKNPIVAKLWAMRHDAKERLGLTDDASTSTTQVTKAAAAALREPKAVSAQGKSSKTPLESATSISYPFSTDEFLLETYINPWGEIRFGKILEDLDALAGNIAFNHVEGTPLIVTAGVDRIRLRHRPQIGSDQHLSGKVTWVGRSSMEIRMQIADDSGDEWMEAYFTFVTLDPETKKPVGMPALVPETNEERALFELGALKAQAKKAVRKNMSHLGQPLTEASLELDKQAAALLREAGPLMNMPSLADPHSILMASTKMQNAMVAQPQLRNLHERIFGGFLMRRAFELAFANAYVFGGARPRFLEVDDISFDSPVDVGDLLVFNSRVLYTQPDGGFLGDYVDDHEGHPLVMMEVEAWVTEPEKADARVSNIFHFTFCLPKGTPCRKVLPANIDEARRMSRRMAMDKEQATLRS